MPLCGQDEEETMALKHTTLAVAIAFGLTGGAVEAQEAAPTPDFSGEWRGEAIFMLPGGVTNQQHLFVIEQSPDGFVTGEHGWKIPEDEIPSHDGEEYTFEAVEPFLGVVDADGDVWLVEDGDTTMFRMHLIDPDTLEFIALESAPHTLVGRGVLERE